MKKFISRVILSFFLFSIALSNFNVNAEASATRDRIYGKDRIETSVKIAQEGWKDTADTALIVRADDYADALCAAPLAKKYDAPIFLSSKNGLSTSVLDELKNLKVKKVFIIGGTGVLSQNIEKDLSNIGIKNVERISGKDRYETSLNVAKQIGEVHSIVIASGNGYADALSIAPIAAQKGMPILLSKKDKLPENIKDYIDGLKVEKSYVIGGSGVISDEVKESLDNSERLGGKDRYETNVKAIEKFKNELNFDTIYVTDGNGYADALSVSSLAAKECSPLMLVSKNLSQTITDFINKNVKETSKFVALGGNTVVLDSVLDKMVNVVHKTVVAKNVKVRIEASDKTIVKETTLDVSNFDMKDYGVEEVVNKPTALNAIIEALKSADIDVNDRKNIDIVKGKYGYYIKGIADISAGTQSGWMYAINNESPAVSVDKQEIKDGDSLTVYFVESYSTVYSFFDKTKVNALKGKEVTLTLKGNFFDENYVAYKKGIEGAEVLVNDEPYGDLVTDKDGKVTLKFDKPGTYIVSARKLDASNNPVISRPYCEISVSNVKEPPYKLDQVNTLIDEISSKLLSNNIDEWTAFDLNRAGKQVPDEFLESLKKKVINEDGDIGSITDYEKVVIGIAAARGNAENFGGYNLVEKIYNSDQMKYINAYIFGLVALDAGEFNVPENAKHNRENIIKAIFDLRTKDGGWALAGDKADPDMTGLALSALAPYYDTNSYAKQAIDSGVEILSKMQTENGGFMAFGNENSNSAAVVIVGLCDNKIDPATDKRFIKNGKSLLDNLLSYKLSDNSGFGYLDNKSENALSTEQAFRALISYKNMF